MTPLLTERGAGSPRVQQQAPLLWWDTSVLVLVDPELRPCTTVELGLSLAQRTTRQLAILVVAWEPSPWVRFCSPVPAPHSWEELRQQGLDEATRACGELVRSIPHELSVTFAVVPGRLGATLRLLAGGTAICKLVIPRQWAEGRWRRWRTRRWRRRGIDLYTI